jgi:hypothetical protein
MAITVDADVATANRIPGGTGGTGGQAVSRAATVAADRPPIRIV